MRRAGLAACGLVLLAGCSGLADDPGSGRTPVEPAPVPVDPPPGVSEDGSVDGVALLSSHVGHLRDGSATVTERRVERFANGSLRVDRETVTYHGPVDRFYVVRTVRGPGTVADARGAGAAEGRYERWANGTVGVAAAWTGDGVEYEPAYPGQFRINRFEQLYPLFATLEPTVRERRLDGRTVFVARADRTRPPDGFGGGPAVDVRNVSFRATIRPDGLVRSYRLTYTGTVDGARVRVRQRLRYDDVSGTTVPRPDWVDDAIERALDGDRGGDADPG